MYYKNDFPRVYTFNYQSHRPPEPSQAQHGAPGNSRDSQRLHQHWLMRLLPSRDSLSSEVSPFLNWTLDPTYQRAMKWKRFRSLEHFSESVSPRPLWVSLIVRHWVWRGLYFYFETEISLCPGSGVKITSFSDTFIWISYHKVQNWRRLQNLWDFNWKPFSASIRTS